MIKKICDLVKIGNNYLLQPRLSVDSNCLVDSVDHIGSNFDAEFIIDLRDFILNKCINSQLHFYVKLFDQDMIEIDTSILENTSAIIYSFNRKKEKRLGKKSLKYYPKIERFIAENHNNTLYLGYSQKINFRQTAYETTGCFNMHLSENGGGFYGLNLNLNNYNIQPKHAVLYIFDKKQNNVNNSYYYRNNRINNIINQSLNYRSEPIPSAPPEPSTPYQQLVEPSAPPCPY